VRDPERMDEVDRVVELDLPWLADSGAPEPVLIQAGSSAVVVAHASVASGHERESVVLSFEGCLATRFGYPNDEALVGHPLRKRGLGYYGIYEALNPSWLLELQEQNRVAFPNDDWPVRTVRHFIVTFHDETFECLAQSLDGQFAAEPRADLLDRLASQTL